jgi:hypothetical protein
VLYPEVGGEKDTGVKILAFTVEVEGGLETDTIRQY